MVIGVFGGSFNPVHAGHISLAREVVARKLADKVVMVLSPLNPLKEDPASLIDDYLRMEMLRIACLPYPRLEASDIELSMPRPSYTIDTLRRLAASNPGDSFRLVIGADNWECFDRWKDYREILRDFHPIVYPREGCAMPGEDSQATPMWADLLPVSSTMIRQRLITGETVNNLIPPAVLDYIRANGLYRRDDPQVI
ncbi:MAG: nicotinate (nicotinamide) nucleotide adenylyltransferase [Muribaculaceae bacterium]|jgi:nicotinate-nucleotide adenylyltransferase